MSGRWLLLNAKVMFGKDYEFPSTIRTVFPCSFPFCIILSPRHYFGNVTASFPAWYLWWPGLLIWLNFDNVGLNGSVFGLHFNLEVRKIAVPSTIGWAHVWNDRSLR